MTLNIIRLLGNAHTAVDAHTTRAPPDNGHDGVPGTHTYTTHPGVVSKPSLVTCARLLSIPLRLHNTAPRTGCPLVSRSSLLDSRGLIEQNTGRNVNGLYLPSPCTGSMQPRGGAGFYARGARQHVCPAFYAALLATHHNSGNSVPWSIPRTCLYV